MAKMPDAVMTIQFDTRKLYQWIRRAERWQRKCAKMFKKMGKG